MSKAVSWNTAGSGFDAREAAREAARRQGKSLGEWLHGVIADNAGEIARGDDASSRDRIEAVTARLERMSATATRDRATNAQGRKQRGAGDERDDASRRPNLVDHAEVAHAEVDDRRDPPRGRREANPDDVLEQAVATMQRRAQRTERRTDEVLASFAQLIETNEQRRERERAGVESLADKLADIEARLSSRDETPIKGTLARLEARLEQIGRRSEAESSARALVAAQSASKAKDDAEPIRRLEEKLNAVLDALASPEAPAAAPETTARAVTPLVELPLRRRRLGEAIAEIAERQRTLDVVPGAARLLSRTARAPAADGGPLSMRLDEIRRAMETPPHASRPDSRRETDVIRRDVAAADEQPHDFAPRAPAAAQSQDSTPEKRRDAGETSAAIIELRDEMRAIDGRLQEVQKLAAHPPGPDMTTLEHLVRDLGARIEEVRAPGADTQAIDALQRQIGTLAARLETTETDLASLASLDGSMRDLFAHLEETRSFAETAAARAATEAVRGAIAERGFDRPAPRADVAVLKAMQEDADLRTRATLDVVHEALDKIVDRLAFVEHGLGEARIAGATRDEAMPVAAPGPQLRENETRPPSRRSQGAPELELGAAEPLLDPRAGVRAPKARKPADLDAGAGRAEFIAAARRAAHVAQTDPSVVAMRRPSVANEPAANRAGLAVKSRDYVASHKRPVLMALAAMLVVAATMTLMQRLPFGAAGPEVAEAPSPSRIAAAPARPMPHAPAIAAQIPGSDPVVTASIASLPSFAARTPGMAAAQKPPSLPAGLAAAAESGDAAAEYTLASAYAEGRAVPRDLAHAARLYAKAADEGIVPAQYRLGALYEKGLGVAQDKARARTLYQQAADAGSPRAMHNLAVLLADGDGKPDYEGAATWFRRAAQLGVRDSQFNLAILLARGLGIDQSLVQSYQWFSIAAAQGDPDAAAKRDEVGTKLSASELSVAKALAAAFHPRAADPAAVDVPPPPGGWDGAAAPVHLNSARSKISSL